MFYQFDYDNIGSMTDEEIESAIKHFEGELWYVDMADYLRGEDLERHNELHAILHKLYGERYWRHHTTKYVLKNIYRHQRSETGVEDLPICWVKEIVDGKIIPTENEKEAKRFDTKEEAERIEKEFLPVVDGVKGYWSGYWDENGYCGGYYFAVEIVEEI